MRFHLIDFFKLQSVCGRKGGLGAEWARSLLLTLLHRTSLAPTIIMMRRINIIMIKCMYATKNEHFLKLCKDEVCLSPCYVLSSLSWVVSLLSWDPETWSMTLRKPREMIMMVIIMMIADIYIFDKYGNFWTSKYILEVTKASIS